MSSRPSPLRRDIFDQLITASNDSNPPVRQLRVLVVDDYPDAAETLAMLLKFWGHEARVCHSGEEALQIARTFRPGAARLDIALPAMDGLELGRCLLQQKECAGVVLVAITGYPDSEHRRRSREAGFTMHLAKPVDLDELRAFLDDVSEKDRQHG